MLHLLNKNPHGHRGLHAIPYTTTSIPSVQSKEVTLHDASSAAPTETKFIRLPKDLQQTLNLPENYTRMDCINAAKTCSDDNVNKIFFAFREHAASTIPEYRSGKGLGEKPATSELLISSCSDLSSRTESLEHESVESLSKKDQVYARSFFSAVKEQLRAIKKQLSGDDTAVRSKNGMENRFAIVNAFTELKKKCANSKFVYSAATLVGDIRKLVDSLLTIIPGGKPYVRRDK